MIAKILFSLVLGGHAYALPLPMETLLTESIGRRVEAFRKLKTAGGYQFLTRTAFNKANGLQTRWRAITTMGRLDPDYFRKELERASQSPEWYMRNAALIALQGDEDRDHAVKISMRLIDDAALVVRTQAVRNLIQLEAREAEPLLWQRIFSDKNFRAKESLWVRVHMAEALSRFTTAGNAPRFKRLLLDSDERLHKWAVIGLENTTGMKLGGHELATEVRRQQWLARLGVEEI